MKWKDSGEIIEKEDKSNEEYFDEEQYSPWSERTQKLKIGLLNKTHFVYAIVGLAVVALISMLAVLFSGGNGANSGQGNLVNLENRIRQLEARLDKYETIDEKVTRIWEQAKTFEKFKDRFDRSEASTSLRMDHLTMSLEGMQKQVNEVLKAKKASSSAQQSANNTNSTQTNAKIKYHKVATGDTLYSISKHYNLGLQELLEINHMKLDSVIVPGQQLIISGQ